jgi:hypothetical protein
LLLPAINTKIFHSGHTAGRYCPVVNLIAWLAAANITSGPIFPIINRTDQSVRVPKSQKTDPKTKNVVWLDEEGNPVALTPVQWSEMCRTIFDAVPEDEFHPCTSHSNRRSSAMWAARCGATDTQVRTAGRWTKGSSAFMLYTAAGLALHRKKTSLGNRDPIGFVWVFQPPVF